MIALLLAATLAQSASALSERAQQAAQAGQVVQAEQLWQQALAADRQYFPAAFNLGLLYTNTQQWDKATPMLAKAATINPGDFNTQYLLGAAYSHLGRIVEALRAWRVATKLRPEHLGVWKMLVVEYGKGHYLQEAAAAAGTALRLQPADVDVLLLAIKAYGEAGQAEKAAALAKQAVERFPKHPRTNFEHAFRLQRAGQFDLSATYLEKAMKLDPNYEEPFYLYGELLMKQSQPKAAIQAYRQALANRSDYLVARLALARALMQLNQLTEAVTELEQADLRQPQPHLLLSQIYFRLGDEAKARAEKALSLKLRREDPAAFEGMQGRPFP